MPASLAISGVFRTLVAASPLVLGPACENSRTPPPGRSGHAEPTAMMAASTPMPATATAPAGNRVEVTADGFQPARIVLGPDRKVVFRRTSDATCATAVVFPGFGIEKPLALNTDVTIELPAGSQSELGFQCGTGMYRGKVVVE